MKTNPTKAVQDILNILKANHVPYLQGQVGIGKSAITDKCANILAGVRKLVTDRESLTKAVAPDKGSFGYVSVRLGLYEAVDFGGLPHIMFRKDNPQVGVQQRAFLENLPQSGAGLLALDEYPQGSPSLQAIMGQLLYERRLCSYIFPPDWRIVCAGNRSTDRAGSNKVPSHVIDRVQLIEFEASTKEWLIWAAKNNVSPLITGYISYQPDSLNVFDPKMVGQQPSSRSWVRLSDILNVAPEIVKSEDDLQRNTSQSIGDAAAIDFATFVKLQNDIPNLSEIMKDGENVPLPDDNKMHYATCIALVHTMKEAEASEVTGYFENALAYIQRMPSDEFAFFFMRQVIGQRKDLAETSTYSDFKIANQAFEI